MGGERLGARTHGGHVPPPRPCGLRDGSTLIGVGAHARVDRLQSVGVDRAGSERSCGLAGREEAHVPCKKNRPKRMNGGCGLNRP